MIAYKKTILGGNLKILVYIYNDILLMYLYCYITEGWTKFGQKQKSYYIRYIIIIVIGIILLAIINLQVNRKYFGNYWCTIMCYE